MDGKMGKSLIVVLLVTCWKPLWSLENNLTMPEVPIELSITSEDDSERELSSQLEEVDSRSGGWSSWSKWSACSRSCDGGASHQLRTCQTGSCRGEHIRYKICNMQPCPDSHEFREDQCTAFNGNPFEGSLYEWVPHYDDDDSCALFCKGKPVNSEELNEDFVLVVAKLADKVHDGTRCRPGSLDMCIEGKCQRVGCDLRIGSTKQIDECGVCGGGGLSCSKPLYHWTLTFTSLCSMTCGGGYKMSRPVCQNRVSGEEVAEELCNDSQKPDSNVVECNVHNCPPKWHTGEWGQCSVSCGGGSKLRQVHCVEETNNTKIRVNDEKCAGHKPWFQEACNQHECPTWITTKWSGCSVSCGEGLQVRGVHCRDEKDQLSTFCSEDTKPTASKPCSTGIQCPFNVDSSEELLPGLYHTQPLVQPYPPPPSPQRLISEQVVPSESTFIPDEWGPCSVSCGEGVRKREVHCKIFLEFSRTIAKLPDKQCTGLKPVEKEKCFLEPCSSERIGVDIKDDPYSRSDIKVVPGSPAKSYSWKEQGYTHCSATCLGGVQELIVNCVRDDIQKVTSPYMCPIELKPEVLMRTCNDHPCPPRWSFSDFSTCSQSCGIGIQTREVNCIHEVTQGGGNTVIVPNNMCPQPPPPDRQYCNVLDCPVRWKVSDWSRCSKSCGGGEKLRKVECKQVMAQNHTVDRPPTMCPAPKPMESKPCNTKSCIVESDKPQIDVSNSTFIQHDPKKKKISLKVGGAATVFLGTTIKIKCPVKRFNRTKIQWMKDKNHVPKTKKYKTSKKGALRVSNLTLRDSGLYTCIAGKSSASIHISVRPKPGEFPTSEEIQKQGFKTDRVDLISDVHVNRDDGNPIFSDDHSHEQKPDGARKKPTSRTRLFTPTLPSLVLDSNLNNEQPANAIDDINANQDQISHLPSSSSDTLNPVVFGNSASSANRIMPNFQKLILNLQQLWPFQTFSNSRGHRMVSFPQEEITEDESPTNSIDEDETESPNENNNIVVLGKGTKENLRFEWKSSPWSKCSETCGGHGYQFRTTKCIVMLNNASQGVDNNLCEDAGLELPATNRKCGFDECPQWTTYSWSPCERSKCFSFHKALQRRLVKCEIERNLTLDNSKCEINEKPIDKQECYNKNCVAKWKVGPWSECAATCEMMGVKYRILQCVWYGTKRSAGMACKDLARPPIMKSCRGTLCSTEVTICKDRSMFCPNVKAMNMCKIARYQEQCCQTCKG